MRPPIARVGGKYYIVKEILKRIPGHITYCEPFLGAEHVFFAKSPSKVEILNDLDGDLITFFRCIKYHPDELVRQIQYLLYSRKLFKELDKMPLETDIQRAIKFYFKIRVSFGAKRGIK